MQSLGGVAEADRRLAGEFIIRDWIIGHWFIIHDRVIRQCLLWGGSTCVKQRKKLALLWTSCYYWPVAVGPKQNSKPFFWPRPPDSARTGYTPSSGVTNSGRVWRKVPESNAWSSTSSNNWILMSCQPHRVTSGQSDSGQMWSSLSQIPYQITPTIHTPPTSPMTGSHAGYTLSVVANIIGYTLSVV